MAFYEPKQRIQSIDILRGVVMVIMALDHLRDYFHEGAMLYDPLDLSKTTPLLFFTRWITHFCAPTFVFLSGVSAYLVGLRRTKKELSAYLLKRGLWLIIIEVTVMTFGLTFNPHYNTILFIILWAIGGSMIILGLLVRTSYRVILVTGLIIFFAHNLLDYVDQSGTSIETTLLKIFITARGTVIPLDKTHILLFGYTIIPWAGIMLLGYCFGALFKPDVNSLKRKRLLIYSGLSLIALFVILRDINLYGDPAPWVKQSSSFNTFLSFINTSKYPPSLEFSCMILGPSLILLALFENVKAGISSFFNTYGKVPFFYFVVHFYLGHIILVICFYASGLGAKDIVDANSIMYFRPTNFGYSLPVVYIIWIAVVLSLYYPCKWFMKVKATHNNWWLSYL